MKVVEVSNLSFSYDKQTILEDVNLSIDENDFMAIIGPNGGGKSTLLKLLLGIHKASFGTISILGAKPKVNLNNIGYVPQDTNINTDFPIKVIEVVLMGHTSKKRVFFGYGDDEIACAMSSLEQVNMSKFAQHKIGSLSGGQRQRVMIARALCTKPKVLMLDEPTSSIDITGQKSIYKLLKKLNKSVTIIVVSHDISVILEYANKAVHINKKISYHDISNKEKIFHMHNSDGHFCEIELLQMLGSKNCETCEDTEKENIT